MQIAEEIIIYTDGASKDNPRRGGIGIRFIIPDYDKGTEIIHDFSRGSYVGATNNQMELFSCIIALDILQDNDLTKLKRITFCVDSNYVLKNIDNARFHWPKNNWLTSDGLPVENVEHWEHFIRLYGKFKKRIFFEKVKAHRKGKLKDIHNDAADTLATAARDNPIKIPFNIINARKKNSNHIAKKGCVEITDEPISIKIVECKVYKKHKDIFKCKYVVISEDNPCFKLLDWIHCNIRLYEGHSYIVLMELRNKNPYIKEVLNDITKKSRFDIPITGSSLPPYST